MPTELPEDTPKKPKGGDPVNPLMRDIDSIVKTHAAGKTVTMIGVIILVVISLLMVRWIVLDALEIIYGV